MTDAQAKASNILKRYLTRFDGEIQGCCPVIADDILNEIGGEPVAGYLYFGGTRRSHWWVELNGEILDPMGDDMMSHETPGSWSREEEHRSRDIFYSILPDYERWRVVP